MAVFRVEKNKGYTVMSNHHLRNKELTLREGAAFSNAVASGKLGLYPCRAFPYQQRKHRRHSYRRLGA